MDKKIEINLKTLLVLSLVLAGGWFFYQIQSVLFTLAISFLVSSAMLFPIDLLAKKIPRSGAILLSYALVIGVLIFLGSIVFPPLIAQTTKFYAKFPEYFTTVSRQFNIDTSVLNANIEKIGSNLIKLTMSLVSDTVQFITVFVISIYTSFERKNFHRYFQRLLGEKRGEEAERILIKVETRLGSWIRGQLTLCLIIGLTTYAGLTVLNFPYAVPLAVMAGILEAVPNLGPVLASIPAIIIGLSNSLLMAVTAAAVYFLIQQFENHLIVPRVMSQAIGLPPLAVLIIMMVGGSLAGTVGIIVSIPVFIVLTTVGKEVKKI